MSPILTRVFCILLLGLGAWTHGTPGLTYDLIANGATCNGIADDSAALNTFNTWALANQGSGTRITLQITSGRTCCVLTNNTRFARGVLNLVVSGYGATLASSCNGTTSDGLYLAAFAAQQNNSPQTAARVATVSAGASSVTVVPSGDAALFTAGKYVLLTGIDLQGDGVPINPGIFEYLKIQSVVGAVVTFTTPLAHSYKSTWPHYNSGGAGGPDQGGPGTLYVLDSSWDVDVEYQGLTINEPGAATGQQINSVGRNITFRDVTIADACIIPSSAINWTAINVTATAQSCTVEADKIVTNLVVTGGTWYRWKFQSSSITNATFSNVTVTDLIDGTPENFAFNNNSSVGTLRLGSLGYGRAKTATCSNSTITTLDWRGAQQSDMTADSMSGGVITIPKASLVNHGAVPWAVPGANIMWQGTWENEAIFQITDVSDDATNTYVTTSLAGGFPGLPGSPTFGVRVHPAPSVTFAGCTGGVDAVSLSNAPAAAPLYSYVTRTYTGAVGTTPQAVFTVWGALVSASINVTNAYSGVASPDFKLSSSDNWPIVKTDLSASTWGTGTNGGGPSVNAKIAGNRVETPSTATGAQSGDVIASPGQAFWFPRSSNNGPQFTADTSAACPGVNCPSVTVTIQTDQGVVP